MGKRDAAQREPADMRSRVSLAVSVCALACCFVVIYFTQYATIRSSTAATMAVSTSMLVTLFGAAALSYFFPIKLRDIAVALVLLLVARYAVFSSLFGSQATAVNVMMGVIFGLSALGAATTTSFTTSKNARVSIVLGFVGAAVLTFALKLLTPLAYPIMQEICLITTTVLLAVFAALHAKAPAPLGNAKAADAPGGPRRLLAAFLPEDGEPIAVYVMLLLFCFGVFEAYASTNDLLLMGSNEVVFTVLCIGLFMLYLNKQKRRTLSSKLLYRFLVVAFAVFVCISSIALLMETFPPEFFVVMGAVSILMHIFIWLYCAHLSIAQKTAAPVLFGIVLGVALVAHRLGWLLATWVGALLGGGSALAPKLAAVTLAAMAITTAVIAVARERKRGAGRADKAAHDDLADRFHDFCAANALTERESEILLLYYRGRSIPNISDKLCISENTVKTHIHHIYVKTGIGNKQEIMDAIERGGTAG